MVPPNPAPRLPTSKQQQITMSATAARSAMGMMMKVNSVHAESKDLTAAERSVFVLPQRLTAQCTLCVRIVCVGSASCNTSPIEGTENHGVDFRSSRPWVA